MAPISHKSCNNACELPGLISLWGLRILVLLNGFSELVNRHGMGSDTLARKYGLAKWLDEDPDTFKRSKVLAFLRESHRKAESKSNEVGPPQNLGKNVERLATLVGLSDTDRRILEFAVLIHHDSNLDNTADLIGCQSMLDISRTLSIILDIPETNVSASLAFNGPLVRSGLLTIDRTGMQYIRGRFKLLTDDFAARILADCEDPIDLLKDVVRPVGEPSLTIDDYEHVASSLRVLIPYLRTTGIEAPRGVNILLHGPPGTGKSQLSRVLALELGVSLHEISSQDSNGNPVAGEQRLRAYRAAQSFFTKSRGLLLFDEAEDVFNDGGGLFGSKSTAQTRKSWINHMLEDNPLPTLWVTNSVESIDSAFVRRFDMVLELPIPPRRQREKIVRKTCGDMLDDAWIANLSESENLSPAVVARAASVIRAVQNKLSAEEVPEALARLINSTMEAQQTSPLKHLGKDRLPACYDPSFLNTGTDLINVAKGLAVTRSGRVCLYGPPGTGKTAFGHWLADQLNIPLHVKRASDLLSMWVGGSEKNIAKAFKDAVDDKALLLIDEVDSFLQNRQGASRSWEVTSVNEMLTQMEQFPGIFIASTNMMHGLDQAALRRFDLKVRFDYLLPEQAWQLFSRQCEMLALPNPLEGLKNSISRLAMLTPGDFAAVARRHRFSPIKAPEELLVALKEECGAKEGGRRKPVGFRGITARGNSGS